MKFRLAITILSIFIILSCRKESYITDGSAGISLTSDTVKFDTVFTSTGSVTQYFLIFNENDQKLKLSSVKLTGGEGSPFSINADGSSGPEIKNIEIAARDSIYVFVTVSVDPTSINTPFIVSDSIDIVYNGNTRRVQLQAYGQNANFLRGITIRGNETWTNEKPYVILGGLLVDENAVLTIEEGTRIHVHADSPLIIDGTLIVNGKSFDSTRVIFSGDRLDAPYKDYPAGWPGIYFRAGSKNNLLNYAIIKNAYQAIVAESPSVNNQPKLKINQCIIDNSYDSGILGIGSDMEVNNSLISNCGKGVILAYGGKYRFTHCTVAAISNSWILHREPVLLITDFIKEGDIIRTASLDAKFSNSIFWGDGGQVDDEVVVGREGQQDFNVHFEHSLWKVKSEPAGVQVLNMINSDPLFDTLNSIQRIYNFRLKANSPALNHGLPLGFNTDLDGKQRSQVTPDPGAYEKE